MSLLELLHVLTTVTTAYYRLLMTQSTQRCTVRMEVNAYPWTPWSRRASLRSGAAACNECNVGGGRYRW